jgi:Dolichyl-phosphate-mannose-protein mannosyltransferase
VATTTKGAEASASDPPGPPASAARTDRRPILALVAVVLVAAGLYASAAQLVSTPRVHPDEHIYAGGGASLAEGEGLTLRGDEYGLGPVYPAILATALSIAGDRETAYHLYKVANGILFALAAIPIFLLARRLLSPWWSVGVAAASVAIPSSMYASVVMTESTSYLAYSLAAYAIVLALERPTVPRQLAVLATVGLAYATRAQFAVLFVAYLAALAVVWTISPEREPLRGALRRLWPSLGALGLSALALLASAVATGSSPVGAYGVLFRGYDPLDIVRWGAYHLADLEIYLAVIPLAVSPVVLVSLWRLSREGSTRSAAFLAAFLMLNGGMLFVTAAFASTEFGFDRLHDRNIFYLAPLWLIVLAVWLADGLPRPLVATSVGAVAALALPLYLPFRHIAGDVGVDVVPSALWARLRDQLDSAEPLSARRVFALVIVLLVAAAILVPRRYRWALPAAVLASFAVTSVLAWERLIDAPENDVFANGLERAWIDERVQPDARVTKLYLVSSDCPASALTWHGLYLSEFFNRRVERAAYIGESVPDGLPIDRVDVRAGGELRTTSDEALSAEYVYTQPGIELAGERVASGTGAELVLWRVGGPVRVVGASSNADLRTRDCA